MSCETGIIMSKYKTEQRKILVDFFENNNHRSVSAQEIFVELAEHGISKSAIYRNLSEMENEGFITKLREKNRNGSLYQYNDLHNCVGIIHLKCQVCESTFHLNRHISHMVLNLAKDENGFTINDTSAFLYGQCANCSQK